MSSERDRLLDALTHSIGQFAERFALPPSDTTYLVATTAVGELAKASDTVATRRIYARGHELGSSLSDVIGSAGAGAESIAAFGQLPAAIPEASDHAASQAMLGNLREALSALMAASGYPADPTGKLHGIVPSIFAWEADVHRLPAARAGETTQKRDVAETLESSARDQGGRFEGARVTQVTPLLGGLANETTLFKLEDSSGKVLDLVCRAETGIQLGIDGRDIGGEYHLLRYLHARGIAVAEPLWLEADPAKFGAKFLVTRKLEGSNFGTVVAAHRLDQSQLRALANQLAAIHALPLDASDPDLQKCHLDTRLVGGKASDGISAYVERWIRLWRSTGLENSPTIEATLSWLRCNVPVVDEAPILVHGDYAMHNIMMQGEAITGVLDWEMSHLGYRAEDLAGIFATLPDEADRDAFLDFYREAGGKPVTLFELEFCNVFRYFGLYVVTLESRMRFLTNTELRPELLVLGSFVQTAAERMAQTIEKAERARDAR